MKYELTNESINHLGITLYRIKALKDFNNVRKGDLGGYIEKESNLSQNDNAWVSGNAWVSIGNCTEKVINLINLCQFNITAYNDYIIVGCKKHTREEWNKLLENSDLYLDKCSNKKEQSKLHFYVSSLIQD